jgi:glycosyltransferase involved in cell wall biosynthesis
MNSPAVTQPARTTIDYATSSQQPIRVLHSVGHLLRGGIEMWLYQVLQRFDASRFEHHVLVRTEQREPFTEDFQRAGFRVLPCLNYNNPVKYRANLRSIIQENGAYDVLHVHGSNPNGLLALLFAKSLGIPATVVHSHNDVRPLLKSRGVPYRAYVQLTLQGLKKFADRGFAVSSLAAESMFGRDWNKDRRWSLLQPGVDFKPFEQQSKPGLRESLNIRHDAFVVGHVGRFHEQKNHLFLLQVMEELLKKCSQAQLLLIGDGPLRSDIVAEVGRRGLNEYIKFVPDTLSVPQFMLEVMNCFVLPSRYEGLGLVAVEAQAAGLPCLLSNRVPKEAVVDSKLVHFLQIEDSPKKWADTILQLRGKRLRVTPEHLQQFYASEFNLDRSADALGRTYEALTNRKKGASADVNVQSHAWNKAS